MSVSKWRVYCQDHAATQITYSVDSPIKCPLDEAHSIDPTRTAIIQTWSDNEVTIKETPTATDLRYGITTITITTEIASGSSKTIDRVLRSEECPMDCYLSSTTANVLSQHIDDIINVYVAPDTLVGVIASTVPASSTVITTSNVPTGTITPGVLLSVGTSEPYTNLGYVKAVDGDTITLHKETAEPITPGEPLRMTIHLADNCVLSSVGHFSAGNDSTRSSFLPAGSPIRVVYKNVSGGAKKFGLFVNYRY